MIFVHKQASKKMVASKLKLARPIYVFSEKYLYSIDKQTSKQKKKFKIILI